MIELIKAYWKMLVPQVPAGLTDREIRASLALSLSFEEEANRELRKRLLASERAFDKLDELYEELIYAVCNKYPGETRHETALRYIRSVETRIGEGMANTSTQEVG